MKKYELEVEKLKAKHVKELEELEIKSNIVNYLELTNLPVPNNIVIPCGDIWATYEVNNIGQALNIINSFELLRYGIYSNGTTSIKPLTQFNKNELEKIEWAFSTPYLRLEKYDFQRETDSTLCFWVNIDNNIIFIRVKIKEGINLIVDVIRDKRGRKIKTEVSCPIRNYNHRLQFYKSGEEDADFRLFFHDVKQIEEVFENVNK